VAELLSSHGADAATRDAGMLGCRALGAADRIDCLADERFADTVVAIERGDYAHLAANV
jgi:hypothetical protein